MTISDSKNINILIVARWPLGGIRTYMRYMFIHFPANFQLTLLAASTQEDAILIKNAKEYGAGVKLVNSRSNGTFVWEISKELQKTRYNLILSQGFLSAVAVYLANLLFHIPHVLTIHGIVEPQYLRGLFSTFKKMLLARTLSRVTVLYAVSNDILEHLFEQFPQLKENGPRAIVIPNGIDPQELQLPANHSLDFRQILGIKGDSIFLFGFFGRFMPQKGFDLLIDAVEYLSEQKFNHPFAIAAVGSGDYLREYQATIEKKGLEQYFYFLPFQPQVHHLYPQVDAIIIPSRWEACPLLPMEVLCMGTPLIASDCLGLRETVSNTPTVIFPSENIQSLIKSMIGVIHERNSLECSNFVPAARNRYDISKSAADFIHLIENLLGAK